MSRADADLEVVSRAVAAGAGVTHAQRAAGFPVAVADRLRADGMRLDVDQAALRGPAQHEVRRRASGDPAGAARRRGGDGGGRRRAPRPPAATATARAGRLAAHRRASARGDPRGVRRAGRPAPRRHHGHLGACRAAGTTRARARCRRTCRSRSTCGRATRRAVLGGHDAHVRGRAVRPRSRRCERSCCAAADAAREAARPGHLPALTTGRRRVEAAGHPHPQRTAAPGETLTAGLLLLPRPRRRAGDPRGPGARPVGEQRSWRATSSRWSRGSRALPGIGGVR